VTPSRSRCSRRVPPTRAAKQGEDADAAGCDRLYDGERRQRQRRDVQPEPERLAEEAGQPAAAPDQQAERARGPANGQRRRVRRRRMLAQIAPVERACGYECERERDDHFRPMRSRSPPLMECAIRRSTHSDR
jgi:hypothetical protein